MMQQAQTATSRAANDDRIARRLAHEVDATLRRSREPRPEETVTRPTSDQLEAAFAGALEGRMEAIEIELRRLADALSGDAQIGARIRELAQRIGVFDGSSYQEDRILEAWAEITTLIAIADGPAFVPAEVKA